MIPSEDLELLCIRKYLLRQLDKLIIPLPQLLIFEFKCSHLRIMILLKQGTLGTVAVDMLLKVAKGWISLDECLNLFSMHLPHKSMKYEVIVTRGGS
jgi:hypothetical protein